MAIGLQSLATVKEDTEVRDRFIDDSLKSYNPDALTDFEYTPSGEYYENYSKPNRPQSVNIPPDIDPFSEDFSPFTTVSPFTDLEIDPLKMDLTMAVESLNLDEGGNLDDPVSQYVAKELQGNNKNEEEQREIVEIGALNAALGGLNFTDPTIIEYFKDLGIDLNSSSEPESQSSRMAKHFETFGIDLEQRQKDYEARKEGGMPFINAGLALTQASRAGLNVPQALASAFAAFSATKDKLNELDPLMLKLALATLPTSTGVGDIEGEFDRYIGDEYLGRQHLTDAMVLNQEARGIDLRPVETGENATSKYYVQEEDGWVLKNLGSVAYQKLVDEKGFDKVQQYDQVAERQIVSVYDKDNNTFDNILLSQYNRDKVDDPERYSVETGDIVKAEYLKDDGVFEFGETMDVNKSWLASNPGWSQVPNAAYRVSMVNGVPQFSNVSSSVAGSLALEENVAKEYTDKNLEYLQIKNQNMGQMATTVGQLSTALDELDGRGGSAVRFFERLKDTYIGGAREILSMYGVKNVAPNEIRFAGSGNTIEQSEEEFREYFKEMDNEGMFGMLNGLGGEERAAAALALENALFSLALQNAMNSYDQTARSISDRDLQFFLRNIGASAGSTPTLVRAVTDEITRSSLTKFDKGIQDIVYYQPTLNDKDRTKPLVRDGYLVLKEGGDPNKRESYEVDPNNPAMKTRLELENTLNNLTLKHGRITTRTNTSFTGGNVFMERLGKFDAENKDRQFTRGGQTYTLSPGQLTNRIDLTDAVVPTSGAGQKELAAAFGQLADNKKPTMKAILNAYNSAVYPRIQELTDVQDDTGVSKSIANQIHSEFLNVFLPRDEDKALFDNFLYGITFTQ